MIITLDLAKTYGQQNADIAKKNKINKIDISVNLQSDSEDASVSGSSNQVNYGPITIDQNYDNLSQEKISYSKINNNGVVLFTTGIANIEGLVTGNSPDFPSYYCVVYYKKYNMSLNLDDDNYSMLKNINSITPIISSFDGSRSIVDSTENISYDLFSKTGNATAMAYMTSDLIVHTSLYNIPFVSSSEVMQELLNVDLKTELDNIGSGTSGFAGIENWDRVNNFNDNVCSITDIVNGEPQTEEINIINEILSLAEKDSNKLNSYINPVISSWNNNGSMLYIDILLPSSIYFFTSQNGVSNYSSAPFTIDNPTYDVVPVEFTTNITYNSFSLYKYNFTQANISFVLDYNVESEERSYFNGNRDYSASDSFLFTEGVINSDTHYVTVVNEETQESARFYDNSYDKTFADEVYEKYENGKLKLEITYPVSHLQTISGIDVVYSEEYGLCTNIGDEYFDENGNKIYVDADDTITTFTQIPEGTLCNIVKNGEVVYKDANGNPKYFLVQNSNLVYSGILVNELTLIESSEQPVSAFDEASWGEINAIGRLGELDKHFSVGEKKYVYMSNQPDNTYTNPVPIVILGFNHDALSNGNGNAGMTLGMETILVDRYPMNNLNINPMSWSDCDFRNTTVPQLMQTLPSDLQAIIKTVKKKSLENNTSTNYTESDDTLFLLSVAEITGADYIINNNFSVGSAEGEQYEYWKTIKDGTSATDRQKLDYNTGNAGEFIPVSWTTRSISTSNPNTPYFMLVDSSGNLTTGSIHYDYGISYAFCIGEKDFSFNGTLQEATWQEVDYIARNGLGSRYFYIGQEKTITLSTGEEITLVVLGFNHDDLSDGSGKAGITFGMKDLFATTYRMNPDGVYNEWENCEMRITTLNNFYNNLPQDLKSVIKNVNKKSINGNLDSTISNISDKLWLLSDVEATGTLSNIYSEEGTQYEYYKTEGTEIKRRSNGTGNIADWWLRTPSINNRYSFAVNGESGVGYPESYTFYGLCFNFCV